MQTPRYQRILCKTWIFTRRYVDFRYLYNILNHRLNENITGTTLGPRRSFCMDFTQKDMKKANFVWLHWNICSLTRRVLIEIT